MTPEEIRLYARTHSDSTTTVLQTQLATVALLGEIAANLSELVIMIRRSEQF